MNSAIQRVLKTQVLKTQVQKHRFLLSPVLIWVLAAGGVTSCGVSPLLHHESPNREPQSEPADPDSQNQDTDGTDAARASCDLWFSSQNLCATLTWVKKPTADEPGEFLLGFWSKGQDSNSGGQALVYSNPDAAKVFVKLWMPDMGHGSSPVTTAQATQANGSPRTGFFRASQVFFVMGGKWEIIVQLKDDSGSVKDTAKMIYQANL